MEGSADVGAEDSVAPTVIEDSNSNRTSKMREETIDLRLLVAKTKGKVVALK
jgi:hypothetical protein